MEKRTLLLKAPEAAKELRVSVAWIYRRMNDGTLPSVKIRGVRRIRRADLEKLTGSDDN